MIDQIKTQIELSKGFNRENRDKVFALLDSLRSKKHWKPTEEQIKAVEESLSLAKNCGEEYSFDLRKLLEQLKAL